jgi:hypothetical protein
MVIHGVVSAIQPTTASRYSTMQRVRGVRSFRFPVKDSDFRSYSDPGGIIKTCVEFAKTPQGVAVRDSKNPHGGTLFFTLKEWAAFVEGVRKSD